MWCTQSYEDTVWYIVLENPSTGLKDVFDNLDDVMAFLQEQMDSEKNNDDTPTLT